jgi:hypothetical protein
MRGDAIKSTVIALTGFFLFSLTSGWALTLGTFNFNDSQFGNTLLESDGGTFRNANWLNVVNANPGNPGALTGANVDTGIANIGLGSMPLYTIGYTTFIANGAGNDLGIISARFSTNDTFNLAVSTDGVAFTAAMNFGPGLAVATGVNRTYFYAGTGPFASSLFVTPVDLSAFGIAAGATIRAVRITSSPEGDLIRVAGLNTAIPEPGSVILMSSGLLALAVFIRWRR